jgi:hypothetical protein
MAQSDYFSKVPLRELSSVRLLVVVEAFKVWIAHEKK